MERALLGNTKNKSLTPNYFTVSLILKLNKEIVMSFVIIYFNEEKIKEYNIKKLRDLIPSIIAGDKSYDEDVRNRVKVSYKKNPETGINFPDLSVRINYKAVGIGLELESVFARWASEIQKINFITELEENQFQFQVAVSETYFKEI